MCSFYMVLHVMYEIVDEKLYLDRKMIVQVNYLWQHIQPIQIGLKVWIEENKFIIDYRLIAEFFWRYIPRIYIHT